MFIGAVVESPDRSAVPPPVMFSRPATVGLVPTFTCRVLFGANVTLPRLLTVSVPIPVTLPPGRTTAPAATLTVWNPPLPTVPVPPRTAPGLTATFPEPTPDPAVLLTIRVPALTAVV